MPPTYKHKYLLAIILFFLNSTVYAAGRTITAGNSHTATVDESIAAGPTIRMEENTTLTVNSGVTVDNIGNASAADVVIQDSLSATKTIGTVTVNNSGTLQSTHVASSAVSMTAGHSLALTNNGTIGKAGVNNALSLGAFGSTSTHSVTNNSGGNITGNVAVNGNGLVTITNNTKATMGNIVGAPMGNTKVTVDNYGTMGSITANSITAQENTITTHDGSTTGAITLGNAADTLNYEGGTIGAVNMGGGANKANIRAKLKLNSNFLVSNSEVNLTADGNSSLIEFDSGSPTLTMNSSTINIGFANLDSLTTGDITLIDMTGGTLTATSPTINKPSDTSTVQFGTPQLTTGAGGKLILPVVVAQKLAATTSNTKGIVQILNNAASTATGDFKTVIDLLRGLTPTQQEAALEKLNPSIEGLLESFSNGTLQSVIQTVLARIAAVQSGMGNMQTGYVAGDVDSEGRGVWMKAIGNSTRQKIRGDYQGYDAYAYGVALGADTKILSDQGIFGYGFSFGNTNIKPKDSPGSKVDIDGYQGMIYANYKPKNYILDAIIVGGYNKYKSKRAIRFNGLNRTATADYGGYQVAARLRAGYKLGKTFVYDPRFEAVPTITAQYARSRQNKYSESGADSVNLTNVHSRTFNEFKAGVGIRVGYLPGIDTTYKIYPYAHFHYLFDFTRKRGVANSAFEGGGSAFKTEGIRPVKSNYNAGAALNIAMTDAFHFILEYDAYLKRKFINHSGSLGMRYSF